MNLLIVGFVQILRPDSCVSPKAAVRLSEQGEHPSHFEKDHRRSAGAPGALWSGGAGCTLARSHERRRNKDTLGSRSLHDKHRLVELVTVCGPVA